MRKDRANQRPQHNGHSRHVGLRGSRRACRGRGWSVALCRTNLSQSTFRPLRMCALSNARTTWRWCRFARIANSSGSHGRMTTNRALTKKEKVVVIQRGMARLPVMGTEAQWAFGVRLKTDFVEPPSWVSRVILMRFDIDPDKRGLK